MEDRPIFNTPKPRNLDTWSLLQGVDYVWLPKWCVWVTMKLISLYEKSIEKNQMYTYYQLARK